jgi:subtilisin family serine protease
MDEDANEKLRRDFARYVVSPGLLEDLKAQRDRRPKSASRRGFAPDRDRGDREVGAVRSPEPTARVIIELNPDYEGGLSAAKEATLEILRSLGVSGARSPDAQLSRYFIFAELELGELEALADQAAPRPFYKVWEDQPLRPLLHRSVRTIKGDACLTAFGADGQGIVVAVADSGIDGTHPHFASHENLDLPLGIEHRNFTGDSGDPLVDEFGHGTHVAGIIAGRTCAGETKAIRLGEVRDPGNSVVTVAEPMEKILVQGVAPKAKIVSLKVLKGSGQGYASALIAALEYVQEVNDNGRRMKIHCVNLSLGYPFDAAWFAAGHSPLCAVVDRVSRSGVVVVAAAGNDGSAMVQTDGRINRQRIAIQAINDPGNAQEAITVGSTHADAPHKYGVSYFSSRGPTADGRMKPDLVAPGERILSCAAKGSEKLAKALEEAEASIEPGTAYFREESGTSMAAPHVSGAVAALLSVRGEFIGRPEAVKEIFMRSCTDLRRSADFQGAGLIDLMRAIQSV